ncbi:MAG TPA: TIGR00282 family metallophosphoesterase [Clostridia bacterium]|nr:TIGR00282 family metallophosphoesterase [Clostridia bacterium]
MKIALIGDIVGRPGRQMVRRLLGDLCSREDPELIIANGENAAGGMGLTPQVAKELFDMGVDVLTSGNHIWDKKEILDYLPQEPRILRPLNYPKSVPGFGSGVFKTRRGYKVAVLNLNGRVFFGVHLDCPFEVGMTEVRRLKEVTPIVVVDFHAEATSEKQAMGWFLDGAVSAVLGTHTHVQTSDERILPHGTGYITDVGMTGPYDSVLGMKTRPIIDKFITQLPARFEVASGPSLFSAVIIAVEESGKCQSIKRVLIRDGE